MGYKLQSVLQFFSLHTKYWIIVLMVCGIFTVYFVEYPAAQNVDQNTLSTTHTATTISEKEFRSIVVSAAKDSQQTVFYAISPWFALGDILYNGAEMLITKARTLLGS